MDKLIDMDWTNILYIVSDGTPWHDYEAGEGLPRRKKGMKVEWDGRSTKGGRTAKARMRWRRK